MAELSFIWDPKKDQINKAKHGNIDFEEAKTVFFDENARIIHDPDHSNNEDRFVIIGLSLKLRLLVVCHCYREKDSVIRIISARKATIREEKVYEKFRNS